MASNQAHHSEIQFSITSAEHSALLTSIILPIPSGVTPYKCQAGSSHLCPAVASNTHMWSSLGHSPLPVEWCDFEKVLEFTLPVSMVNTVVQQLPYSYFFNTKALQGKCFEQSTSHIFIRLTVLGLCKDPAFWSCAFSVSPPPPAAADQWLPLLLLREYFKVY